MEKTDATLIALNIFNALNWEKFIACVNANITTTDIFLHWRVFSLQEYLVWYFVRKNKMLHFSSQTFHKKTFWFPIINIIIIKKMFMVSMNHTCGYSARISVNLRRTDYRNHVGSGTSLWSHQKKLLRKARLDQRKALVSFVQIPLSVIFCFPMQWS